MPGHVYNNKCPFFSYPQVESLSIDASSVAELAAAELCKVTKQGHAGCKVIVAHGSAGSDADTNPVRLLWCLSSVQVSLLRKKWGDKLCTGIARVVAHGSAGRCADIPWGWIPETFTTFFLYSSVCNRWVLTTIIHQGTQETSVLGELGSRS